MDVFEAATIEIFRACIECHPQPAEIQTQQLAILVTEYFAAVEDDQLQEQINQLDELCNYAIIWLKNEGFLRDFGSSMDSYVVNITLQGLNAINAVPKSIEGKSTFGEVFRTGLGGIPFSVASSTIAEFFKNVS